MSGGAALFVVLVYGLSLAIALALSIYVLRRGTERLRLELERIGDILEMHFDPDE